MINLSGLVANDFLINLLASQRNKDKELEICYQVRETLLNGQKIIGGETIVENRKQNLFRLH